MFISWPLLQGNICKMYIEYGSASSIWKQCWICPMIKIKNCPLFTAHLSTASTLYSYSLQLQNLSYLLYCHLKYFTPPIATSIGFPSGSCEQGPMCCSLQYSLLFLASQTNHELVNQGSKQPQADGCQETSGECPWLWLSLTLSWSTCCTLGLTWSWAMRRMDSW